MCVIWVTSTDCYMHVDPSRPHFLTWEVYKLGICWYLLVIIGLTTQLLNQVFSPSVENSICINHKWNMYISGFDWPWSYFNVAWHCVLILSHCVYIVLWPLQIIHWSEKYYNPLLILCWSCFCCWNSCKLVGSWIRFDGYKPLQTANGPQELQCWRCSDPVSAQSQFDPCRTRSNL